jgi:hypothetical protein
MIPIIFQIQQTMMMPASEAGNNQYNGSYFTRVYFRHPQFNASTIQEEIIFEEKNDLFNLYCIYMKIFMELRFRQFLNDHNQKI